MKTATATDFNDLSQLRGNEVVRKIVTDAPLIEPTRIVVVDASDLLTASFPPREMLLSPWLESQSLSMIYAWRGVGKTHVALGIAYALASGGEFLGWRARAPVSVLYLDGEMPGAALRERLANIVANAEEEAAPGNLRFVTPDLQPNGIMPNLGTHEGQADIEQSLTDARVIVVDNLSCMVRGGKENEADSWLPVADWALRMRARGRSVIFIHHSGKNGQQRGTSKREDLLDVVIMLKRPADYSPDEGARFEVHFEKARSLHGQDVAPLEAALETLSSGKRSWATRTVEDATDVQMIELATIGLPQAEIARELGVHRSTVLRALKKAQDDGRYVPKAKARRQGGHRGD
ncbi:MAG: AAA family ATPase [Dokdonella sp.]